MAKNETLHIRVNDTVKAKAEQTLEQLGLSISDAVNLMLHQIGLVGGLPFEVKIPRAPETVIVNSDADLYEKLRLAEEQIENGSVISAETVMARLRDKYGFQD